MTPNNAETMRLFVAVALPEEIKRELTRLQESLKKSCRNCPARWVSAENIHLTLNFLGEVVVSRLPDIERAVTQACAGIECFDLNISETGAFPNLEKPRVIWVGMHGDLKRLVMLQKVLEQSLSALGFTPDTRGFSPHLTLARVSDEAFPGDKKRLGEAAGALSSDCSIPVSSVSLMRSQLMQWGPVYTVLVAAPLLQKV
jgi:2'-5' RNA ligase